jgi:hypothetical protein
VHGDRLAITRLEMVFGYLRKRLAFLRRVGPSRLVQRTLAAKSVALAYSSASANSPSRPARDRSTAKLTARVDLTAPDRCQNSVTDRDTLQSHAVQFSHFESRSRGVCVRNLLIVQCLGESLRFRNAVATGRAERDPAADLRGALAPVNETHYAAITDPKAIGALLRASTATGAI